MIYADNRKSINLILFCNYKVKRINLNLMRKFYRDQNSEHK